MKLVILAAVSTVCTIAAFPLMAALVHRFRLIRPNFQGREVPAGFGFLLVISAVPAYVLATLLWPDSGRETGSFLVAVLVFGTTGLADDIYGSRSTGGFKGHFAQLAHGKVTTGAIKAIAGGVTALLLGGLAAGFDPVISLLNGLVIALTANLLNLLDLRPGRAVSCYWVILLGFAASRLGRSWAWYEMIPILPAAVWLTKLDRRAQVMLGDAGSNVLGVALGMAFAWNLGAGAKLAVLIALIAVHLYAEKYSISRLIDGNRVLQKIDYRLGER